MTRSICYIDMSAKAALFSTTLPWAMPPMHCAPALHTVLEPG